MPESKLTQSTWLPLGGVLMIGVTLLTGVYQVHQWMLIDAIWKARVDARFEKIEVVLRVDRWSRTDMMEWTSQLRSANPDIEIPAVTRGE